MAKGGRFKGIRTLGAALLVVSGLIHGTALSSVAEEVSVAVKTAVVRKAPSFISPSAFQTVYGDRFDQIGGENGWIQVRSGKGTGWLHESAVTVKTVDLSSVSASSSAAAQSGDAEVVFAAKGIDNGTDGAGTGLVLPGNGFDAAAEKVLAAKGHAAGYSSLDKLAAASGKGGDLASFAKQGGLLK